MGKFTSGSKSFLNLLGSAPDARKAQEIVHDLARDIGGSRHFDMELSGVDGEAGQAQALSFGEAGGAGGGDEFPAARSPGDLTAVTLHDGERFGQAGEGGVLADLLDGEWAAFKNALIVIAATGFGAGEMADVSVEGRFGRAWVAAVGAVPGAVDSVF